MKDRITELEKALSDMLDIIDGEAFKGVSVMAFIHGYQVDKETSERNGTTIDKAYELLNKERSK